MRPPPLRRDYCRFRRGKPVDKIRSALRVAGGGEGRALVVLQDFEPVGDVGGMILARLQGEIEIGAEEGRSQIGPPAPR